MQFASTFRKWIYFLHIFTGRELSFLVIEWSHVVFRRTEPVGGREHFAFASIKTRCKPRDTSFLLSQIFMKLYYRHISRISIFCFCTVTTLSQNTTLQSTDSQQFSQLGGCFYLFWNYFSSVQNILYFVTSVNDY